MTWRLVPCLSELRDQINEIAPARDRASDGTIGDTAHAASRSSHNPDESGTPEWRDTDSTNEVRAVDIDADLRQPDLTMELVVQHLVRLCRSGRIWWLRYIIYRGRIWHRRDGWQTRTYTGSNRHDKHAHVNSDFTDAADRVSGVDYHLRELIDMALTAEERKKLDAIHTDLRKILTGDLGDDNAVQWWIRSLANRDDPLLRSEYPKWPALAGPGLAQLGAQLAALRTEVAALAGRDLVDEQQIADALPRPPSAEENAEALVRRLGEESPDQAAASLVAVLGPDRAALLATALAAAARGAGDGGAQG